MNFFVINGNSEMTLAVYEKEVVRWNTSKCDRVGGPMIDDNVTCAAVSSDG